MSQLTMEQPQGLGVVQSAYAVPATQVTQAHVLAQPTTTVVSQVGDGLGASYAGGVAYAAPPTVVHAGAPVTAGAMYVGGSMDLGASYAGGVAYAATPTVVHAAAPVTAGATYVGGSMSQVVSQPVTTVMSQPVTTVVSQPQTTVMSSRAAAGVSARTTKMPSGSIPAASTVKPTSPGASSVEPDGKFVDLEFPPNDTTLGRAKPGRSFIEADDRAKCKWVRIPDLIKFNNGNSKEPVYWEQIGCQDLSQGQVGDCWLVSSINVCGEFPEMVARIFKMDPRRGRSPCPYPEGGQHTLSLYDMATCTFVDVTIDDYVPCTLEEDWDNVPFTKNAQGQKVYGAEAAAMQKPMKYTPFFGKSDGHEAWPLLMEKAMAKFAGSYALIAGGQETYALTAFTGMPQAFVFRRPSTDETDTASIPGVWDVCGAQHKEKHENVMQTNQLHESQLNNQVLFDLLSLFDKEGFLMCVNITKYPPPASIDQYFRPDGLVSGHAYGLMGVHTATDHMGRVIGFVHVRNPHGYGNPAEVAAGTAAPSTEWNGKWSDGDPAWEDNPEIKSQLGYEAANDGNFWMDWDTFVSLFDEIDVVPRKVKVEGAQAISDAPLPISLEKIISIPCNADIRDDLNRLSNIGMQFARQDGRPILQPYDPFAKIPGFLLGTTQRTSPMGIKWLASKPGRLQELVDYAPEAWQKEYYLKKIREQGCEGALGKFGHLP